MPLIKYVPLKTPSELCVYIKFQEKCFKTENTNFASSSDSGRNHELLQRQS